MELAPVALTMSSMFSSVGFFARAASVTVNVAVAGVWVVKRFAL